MCSQKEAYRKEFFNRILNLKFDSIDMDEIEKSKEL